MAASPNHLNPLPNFHSNAALQRQSVHELFTITKPVDLLLRGEQYMDYGVDATFEVLVDDHPTNYTAQVQIKAVQSAEFNLDGSVSKAIEVPNLNYLLNGQCPIYLLYASDQNKFWFAGAFDELKRLEVENPHWREQGTVTIRFSGELCNRSLTEIHSRIIKESQCRREVVETLARYALHDSVKFAVNSKTLKAENADDAYQSLLQNGFTQVSCGLWREVLERYDLLSLAQKREPRICIIAAYAHYSEGRCLCALGHCGDAYLRISELNAGDRDVLETIRDACECLLGRITRDEYTQRQMAAAAMPNASMQRRIEACRFQLLAERDDDRRTELFDQLKSLAAEVLADKTNGDGFKLQTRMHVAYAEGCQCLFAVTKSIGFLNIQRSISKLCARPDTRPLHNALSAMARWDAGMHQLIRDTEAAGIPWLHAEARRTALWIRTAMLGFRRFQAKFLNEGSMPSRSEISGMLVEAGAIADLFAVAGNIKGEMRAKIATADLYEIIDDAVAEKKIAAEVKRVADALSLQEIGVLAEQHLTGSTILRTNEASTEKRRQEGSDLEQATMSDADIEYFAQRMLSVSQLPDDRLPVLRREVESMKQIAIERLDWCRHIQQIQNLFHSSHSLTNYATDPQRFCKCLRHDYESLQGSTDSRGVIDHFKKAYCVGCADRSPKMPARKGAGIGNL